MTPLTRRVAAASLVLLGLSACSELPSEPLLVHGKAAFSAAAGTEGGALYGVAYSGAYPNGLNKLYQIDPVSGGMVEQASFPSMQGLGGGLSAVDAAGGRYFVVGSFPAGNTSEPRIVAVDMESGAGQIASQRLLNWPSSIAYDATTASLYAVIYVGQYPNGLHTLYRVDPTTGSTEQVGAFGRMEGLSGGLVALDAARQRYTIVGSIRGADQVVRSYLISMDLRTGASVVAATPLETYLSSLELDPSSSNLYGVLYRGSYPTGLNTVVRLDPVTGAANDVGSFPQMVGLSGILAAIDPAGSRYFVIGTFGTLGAYRPHVVSMSLSTGASTVATQSLPTFLSALDFVGASEPTVEQLIADVQALQASGSLGGGQTNALLSTLRAAQKQQEKGNMTPAANQLAAFVNHLEAYVRGGVLSPAEAQPLIDATGAVIAALRAA